MSGQTCLEDNDYSTDAEVYDIYSEAEKFSSLELPKKSDITFVTLTDVIKIIQERCKEIGELLDVREDEALIILNHYKWRNDLLESDWFGNEDHRRKQVGIDAQEVVTVKDNTEALCSMCFDSKPREEFDSLQCNHVICNDCWTEYIQYYATRSENGFFWKCPMDGCNMVVSDTFNKKYIDTENLSQYHKKMARAYTDTNKSLRWCPAVNCQYGVEAVNLCAQPIECKCGWIYCFKCGLEDHRPCPCDVAEQWIQHGGNTETVLYHKWLLVYTKDCPKCKKPIEKNQGCNHMTCRNLGCAYEFCWMCLEKWDPVKNHYTCPKYDVLTPEQKQSYDDQKKKERIDLSRYCAYSENFKSYADALKIIESIKKLIELEKESFDYFGIAEHQMDFLKSACQTLQNTKRLIKWSYAYTFGLTDEGQRNVCEILQLKLKRQADHLQRLLEWKYEEAKYSKYYAECKENIRSAEFKCKQLSEAFMGKVDEAENMAMEEKAKIIWNEKMEEAKKVKEEEMKKVVDVKKKKRLLAIRVSMIIAMLLFFASFWVYNPVFFVSP